MGDTWRRVVGGALLAVGVALIAVSLAVRSTVADEATTGDLDARSTHTLSSGSYDLVWLTPYHSLANPLRSQLDIDVVPSSDRVQLKKPRFDGWGGHNDQMASDLGTVEVVGPARFKLTFRSEIPTEGGPVIVVPTHGNTGQTSSRADAALLVGLLVGAVGVVLLVPRRRRPIRS